MAVSFVSLCGLVIPDYKASMSGDSRTEELTGLETTGVPHFQSPQLETWIVVLLTVPVSKSLVLRTDSQPVPSFRTACQMNSEGVLWPRLDKFISFPNSMSKKNSWLFTAGWAGRFH